MAELRRRFDRGADGAHGVHLLTYHRAKGLEFDAVFLPRLDEKELPSRMARTPAEQAEERRLFYVGITRARRTLAITCSQRPSPFLAELGSCRPRRSRAATRPRARRVRVHRPPSASPLAARACRADGVPAYVIFPDRTIEDILARRPQTLVELSAIHGLGPARLSRFGPELREAVADALSGAPSGA